MQIPTDITPRPDIEDILCDLLEQKVTQIVPMPKVVTELPADYEQYLEQTPFLTVRKTTGAGAVEAQVDVSFIEITVIYRSRREAWQLLNYLTAWLTSLDGAADLGPARLVSIEEVRSPVMPQWLNPEHRRVQADFRVEIRRPR
ncbi:tail terminator [Corynebacterium phage Colleen]|uniref:Tail terminator n=4 Tax=root TaxID=1 RepID=W5Y523_9CORY|nr:hypothetical protein [Corynebacterium vitaeruminis]YP_009626525.1 hypothetical protein FDK28_gp13 [Corynebacterium phage Poushou]AWY06461.1 head-to-tail connector complex protein [Corynebacterium phage TouchMeNot]QFG14762.1 tail terminator [Corynebacterium phage Colleen]UVT31899.1 tail terminator [Corynebacterium phage Arianna]AHI21603.1 hypothetical protein B843_01035 [Corynebacterium vitaeruminis DSM 20294]ASJ78972.1 hypothetical protein PBI_POUSHOU_13 [Corynebacterium phage Poushou]